ncbi:MAG: GIY-YIG nuclease family protein [Nitrospiraceae bacterium]|nr:GIY-YIG nuclease family protein [Nitrospiraceae bacterium]
MEKPNNGAWCVYVLKCRNNYLYIGITNNLDARLAVHRNGTGSKFVGAWRPFELLKAIACESGREARMLEYRLKKMKRSKKLDVLGIDILRELPFTPASRRPDKGQSLRIQAL